jgi:hypothetical protein
VNQEETFVALVHHPVYDRGRRIVSTALTNLDLHDIARSVRTYGLAGFFIVHPVGAQRALAERIANHWRDEGAEKNDFRRQAIERMRVVSTLGDAARQIESEMGRRPLLIGTAARHGEETVGFGDILKRPGPGLCVLGTGWGLTDELLQSCDVRLRPIAAGSDYNHLSVRSACAIILDRLYGDREH